VAVRLERGERGGQPIAEIVLDAGDDGNWLTTTDIEQLRGHLRALRGDLPVLTLLRQEGADFTLGRRGRPDERRQARIYRLLDDVTRSWADLPCVTVTALAGRCEGFGVGLALQADVTIAGDDVALRFPEIEHGFAPAIVLAWLTRLLPWQVVAPHVLMGHAFDTQMLRSVGVLNEVVARDRLHGRVEDVVTSLLIRPVEALHEAKRFSLAIRDESRLEASRQGVESLVRHFDAE
jgi:enoyl-CoA hydratase/carnithine racemase